MTDPTPTPTPANIDTWINADFQRTNSKTWAPAQMEYESWMCRTDSKAPYAPWTDPHAPVECTHSDHPTETLCSDCAHSAQYKWGSDGSREYVHTDHETAREWADKDPSLAPDLAFIQRDSDPFLFVDGDDVRCPETGKVHPEFIAILEKLGISYGDISVSESGCHVVYLGDIPLEGVTQAQFAIDDEPLGANDDIPEVEIYPNKHVCIATGEHVRGSGTEVNQVNTDALGEILEEHGFEERDPISAGSDIDMSNHSPNATTSNETTGEIKDLFAALDRIDARRVASDTIVHNWNNSANTSGENKAFTPTWGINANGTANIVNHEIWQDTGGSGYGGPDVMAAIDCRDLPSYDERTQPRELTGEDWFRALEHLRELGYEIPELDTSIPMDADPTAAIPLEILDTLDHDEARRFATQRGVEWPTTREAREELRTHIFEVMNHGDKKILDAPTALGKSYTVATEPWLRRTDTTGDQPVVHLHETKKARDQAIADSEDAGVESAVLLGRSEACPVAAGEHDPLGREGTVDDFDRETLPETVITVDGIPASEWFEQVCEGRGLPFSVAHTYLAANNDQGVTLPCEEAGDVDECPAITQWEGLPRGDEGEIPVDVIHATHGFAHVPSLRNMTNVIFDERPKFKTDLSHQRVRRAVTAYLTEANSPVDTWEQFVTAALEGGTWNEHGEHATIPDALNHEPDREWYLEAEDAHTLAPALTRAIFYSLRPDEDEETAQDANGRYSATVPHEPPRLDAGVNDESGWNRTWVTVVLDENNTVRVVRNTPDMGASRSVVGLDAHPSMTQWQQNVHPDIQIHPVLDSTERALWRRYERGLLTVGVGDATRPYTSGEYFDEDGSRAFFAALRERFGDRFRTAITAASVEPDTQEILSDVGVDDPDTMHYGEEKSRGDFGDEDIGALNGCIDPGDEFVLDLLAEAGLEATPETTTDEDGSEHRAHGRGFVGPDADAANEILASVREQHVAQSAGRYARNADDPEDRAIVFVRTTATPPGFVDLQVPGVERPRTETQREVISELRERPHATAAELGDAVGCSKEHVRNTLTDLEEEDVVDVRERAGEHGAHLYRALAGIDAVEHGSTDLTPEGTDTTNDDVCNFHTWSLAIASPTPPGSVTREPGSTPSEGSTATPSTKQAGITSFDTGDPPD